MGNYYTSERHTQILIALLKEHGIKNIVASPGSTNVCLVGSLQQDPYFNIYSSVDERSGCFIACGLAAETGEPVAITCTGSTASRNYIPGLTEAYYRHLPVLAITSSQHLGRAGNLYPQFIDRASQLNDMINESVQIEPVNTDEDIWACEVKINRALIALKANGGGPAHINLVSTYSKDYSVKELPSVKKIDFVDYHDEKPEILKYHHVALLVGVHGRWSDELSEEVEKFCKKFDAVVLQYHACNYKGDFGVNFALSASISHFENPLAKPDLIIYFGSVARYKTGMDKADMWRVSLDGNVSDPEKTLTKVFRMNEVDFFKYYNSLDIDRSEIACAENGYARLWQKQYEELLSKVPELPFSNVWVAKNLINKLPDGCVLHLAGSNTARSWNFFKLPKGVECYSNDGTMGIDGQVSALIGESLASPNRIHFGAVGDLTFFYDMNSLGNRHIGKNIRLLVVNNGKGAEFKLYKHPAYDFGEQGDNYMAAAGHYGNKSPNLIKHYAEDLGYEYMCARDEKEFLDNLEHFAMSELSDKSMIFEVFTDSKDESDAIYIMDHLIQTVSGASKDVAKNAIKKIAGEKGLKAVKSFLGK